MKDYDQGYNDAIEELRKQLHGQDQEQGLSRSSANPDNKDSQGNPQQAPELNPDDQKKANQQGSGQDSSRGSSSQGVVQPEDCTGDFGDDQPGTAGTYTDRKAGKKLAESEGYEDNQGGDDSLAKEWKDTAIKNKSKLRGSGAGMVQAKIEAVWNTTTDWKKALRDIVGRAINNEDKRWAFANKNVLVSQDRIARTDKDKYDVVDYMTAFIDSSGSMSDVQLQLILGEIYNIALKKKPIKFVVIQCDTRIQEIKEYNSPAEIRKDFKQASVKGRGGTELRPCWELLAKDKKYNKRPTELCIVFTDGYLTQYKRNPRTMNYLVWCILDNPGFKLENPDPKTKVIYLNTKDVK